MDAASNDIRQIDIIKIFNTKRCLVIDDFPEIRGSMMRTLRNFGAEAVDTAADGEEAVRLCTQNKYDIVICDYNLGMGKDGQQVLEEVRYLRVLLMTSLFIMLTGESSREMVLGALECQPDDYITKPYTEASLRTRLNRAILRHEALMYIKKAISEGDYQTALDGCNQVIKEQSKYTPDCIKLKGQLLFILQQLTEAQKLYESVLSQKPLTWAKLGLGKTMLAQGKLDAAEELFEDIIREDPRYIEAHDLLAKVFVAKKDMLSAQKSTERACQVSPKSVHRHRTLADYSDINGDDEIAAKSYQQAIKWGLNSCYESSQDYFNYVRKVSDLVKACPTAHDNNNMIKQAGTFLDRARKRFNTSVDAEAQSYLVESQLLLSQNKTDLGVKTADKGKALYNSLRNPSVDTSIELARNYQSMNKEDEARAILNKLVAMHPNDSKLLQVIDNITSEPISEDGKGVAAKLTKSGIQAFEQKNFTEAIEIFSQALINYPKHIGLNLNLIQAILSATETSGLQTDYEKICRRSVRAIGNINSDHKQFKRYAFLQKQLSKFYPSALQVV